MIKQAIIYKENGDIAAVLEQDNPDFSKYENIVEITDNKDKEKIIEKPQDFEINKAKGKPQIHKKPKKAGRPRKPKR